MSKLWFKAPSNGWGVYPCSWEGWAVSGIFLTLLFMLIANVEEYTATKDGMLLYFSAVFSLAGILMIIAYKKGERPPWGK
jgi:hypothetical protein